MSYVSAYIFLFFMSCNNIQVHVGQFTFNCFIHQYNNKI